MLKLFSRTPVAVLPRPVAQTVDNPSDEYKAVASRLGISIAEAPSQTLESILNDEMIPRYSMVSVSRYMDRLTPKGKVWGWAPLRAIDIERSKSITMGYNDKNGRFIPEVYKRPIPLPVLLTIEKIENEAKEKLPAHCMPAFFVTDYTAKRPDPFLMVCCPGMDVVQEGQPNGNLWLAIPESCHIIERWDEPSFRG